jgi:uncharacterized protein YndB with AHSA1/START domain
MRGYAKISRVSRRRPAGADDEVSDAAMGAPARRRVQRAARPGRAAPPSGDPRETAAVTTTREPLYRHSAAVEIAAPPEVVWRLVTAMERYGEWSSENPGGYWRKGPDGVPGTGKVGDQFVGINRRDGREWKAPVEIVERDEGRTFAFITGGSANNWVYWRYDVEPSGDGTRLVESWELRNLSPPMIERGQPEVDYRVANAKESLEATLAAMKRTAEREAGTA